MFEKDFEKLLSRYGDTVLDRTQFMGLVKDVFPTSTLQTNIILSAYELGIASDIQNVSRITNAFAYRFVKQMVGEQGISRENADWAVAVWCVCYGQHYLGKTCDIKLPSAGSNTPAIKDDNEKGTTYGELFNYVKCGRNGNELAVTGFTGKSQKTIIFQNTSSGKAVTKVNDGAFEKSDVEEAIFADGFREIGRRAFCNCKMLSQVIFPESLKILGDYSFAFCNHLTLATLPPFLEEIGAYALSGTGFKSVKIPNSIYYLGEGAFSECCNLIEMAIPETIAELPDKLFYGCTKLKKVTLGNCIKSIGAHAFDGCLNLGELLLPESVKEIREGAFDGTGKKFILLCNRGSFTENFAREHHIRYQLI